MKHIIPILLIIGCDKGVRVVPEPIFDLASKCIEQMIACEDWTPKLVEHHLPPLQLEECERLDYSCERRNNTKENEHAELQSRPPFMSSCEIKTRICTNMIEAVASQKEHHHYHTEPR